MRGEVRDDDAAARDEMVRTQIAARGIGDDAVLCAMRDVPRDAFVPPELREFAYRDSPLPIGCGQTISQPYMVALMAAALQLRASDRVLDVGTGSGYAAAVLARIAREVYTIERHPELAAIAERTLRELGYENVHVRVGDGTLGWPDRAPYDAIAVAAGGPAVPDALLDQLAPGGRLVIPIGEGRDLQELVRVTRRPDGTLERESLGDVRFVPLIGVQGWQSAEEEPRWDGRSARPPSRPAALARLVRESAIAFDDVQTADVDALVERVGDARVVCLGEATHGTSEFYRMRARITRALVERRGFAAVAVEADWPDAARIDRWIRGAPEPGGDGELDPPFTRFPTWMWRNREVLELVEWLRQHNRRPGVAPVGFHGLDLYSLSTSIRAVLDYLDRTDPAAAALARRRYACLTPWEKDPAAYGDAAIRGRYRVCEEETVAMLRDILVRRLEYAEHDGVSFLDAARNAALVANAERYYRAMYYGGDASWNLRDRHMFETLCAVLDFHGADSKVVVWEHNSHLGDARATELGATGQLNVGQLCRERFDEKAYLVGFGTDRGTVAAAHAWDGLMKVMRVRPAHRDSYERTCRDSERPAFFLPLRDPVRRELRDELQPPRLERAIGVVYRPETELQSHYFHASLPLQFDEWIWIGETRAVHPLGVADTRSLPPDHPFAVVPQSRAATA
ncbi:MAG TPA: protein-L-isoaspartate(D-aspartate) O-methyltransferase [Candidatus Binatia bacterium]|nr:protein-L-isoaspartate(D-aspartate) O-methyltransferase [Candidatus Binatia bacterium]